MTSMRDVCYSTVYFWSYQNIVWTTDASVTFLSDNWQAANNKFETVDSANDWSKASLDKNRPGVGSVLHVHFNYFKQSIFKQSIIKKREVENTHKNLGAGRYRDIYFRGVHKHAEGLTTQNFGVRTQNFFAQICVICVNFA